MRIFYSLPASPQAAVRMRIEWVALSSLAPLLGSVILSSDVVSWDDLDPLILLFLSTLPGILFGIAQRYSFNSLLPMYLWALLTAITYQFFFVSALNIGIVVDLSTVPYELTSVLSQAATLSLFALLMAIAQYYLLRKCFRNAELWILAVVAGSLLTLVLPYPCAEHQLIEQLLDLLLSGAILGVIAVTFTGLYQVSRKPLQLEMLMGA